MEPMITAAPARRGALLHGRDSSSGKSSGALDTCGYLSGDYATPLTCGLGYTCSTGPSLLPSHLGCCNAVNCAPSSGAHTCITATSGTIPCTGSLSSDCISQYTSLLFCTDPTAPACITYSQPPPTSGSVADSGFSPTIFSYSCGPTQTTHVYLATATNAPASATPHTPVKITHLPTYAYVAIGVGGLIVLHILGSLWNWYRGKSKHPITYRCRVCLSSNLSNRVDHDGSGPNVNRPYCICVNPGCSNCENPNAGRDADHYNKPGWVSWRDDIGVADGNPHCHCRWLARKDLARSRSQYFWTCRTGSCYYFDWVH